MGAAQLGKYQLVAEIARGGMGIVYLAIARGPARFHKLLVIKQLKPDLAEDPVFLEMFLEEARLAARLNHPNIVQTYEIGSDEDRHYMVMDYLEGIPLARILKKRSPDFTLAMRIRVACEVLQGLQYAHSLADFDGRPLGIVHRDATPHNVFITYDGQVKLVDFGIAKATDSTVETATGVMKGKPAYMSPEQISGNADARADLFSIGVMLWEAVAGRRMWERRTDVEIVAATIKGEIPSIREAAPNAPPELLRIIERALAVPAEARYASAAEFLTDLEAFLPQMGTHVTARDVGRLAANLFAAERASDKSRIETYLAGIDSQAEVAKLPSLRPPRMDGSISEFSFDGGASGSTQLESSVTPGLRARLQNSSVEPAPPPPRRNIVVAVLSFVVVVAALLVIVLAIAGRRASSNAVAALPKGEEGRTVAESPPTHEVTVRAFPEAAIVTIDGAEVSNPVKRTCVQGTSFSVHASAPGTVSTDRKVSCDRDESIEIALTAQPRPAPAPAPTRVVVQYMPPPKASPAAVKPAPAAPPRPAEPVTPPPRSNDVSPSGGTKPNRPIDTSSPYGQ